MAFTIRANGQIDPWVPNETPIPEDTLILAVFERDMPQGAFVGRSKAPNLQMILVLKEMWSHVSGEEMETARSLGFLEAHDVEVVDFEPRAVPGEHTYRMIGDD